MPYLGMNWEDNIKMDLKQSRCGLIGTGLPRGFVCGCCEHAIETVGSVEAWEYLDWLTTCHLLKASDAWSELVARECRLILTLGF